MLTCVLTCVLTCRRKWRRYKYSSFFSWRKFRKGICWAGLGFLVASMEPVPFPCVLCFLYELHLEVLMPNLSHEELHEEETGLKRK